MHLESSSARSAAPLESAGKTPRGGKSGGGLSALARRPKTLAIAVGGLALLVVAAVVAPNIPQQMRRSEAFQSMENGDYAAAAAALDTYILERPNDAEAGLQYALAALHIGDYAVARGAFEKYAGSPSAQREDIALGRALTQMDNPDIALPLLDELVSRASGNAAAHLTRGVLFAAQDDSRRARDDFIQADDLIRGYVEEDPLIGLAHKILLQNIARREFTAPTPAPKSPAPVEGRIGFPLGAAGFDNRYALPDDEAILNENPPQSAIPALYYAHMLIEDGQRQEAETELGQASSLAPDLLMATNLEAFMLLQQAKFTEAAEKLSAVVERAPNSPRALLNLANAQWSENPDPARWESAAAAYDEILANNPDAPEAPQALNNRGHIRTFGGNLKGAREDFSAAIQMLESDDSQNAKSLSQRARFNLAVIQLAEGYGAEALDDLEKLAEEKFPTASRALVAAAEIAILPERAARHRAALAAAGEQEPLLATALHYERRGLLLRALWTLGQIPPDENNRDILEFRRGRILAKLQNADGAGQAADGIADPRRAGVLRAVMAAADGEGDAAVERYRQALDAGPPPTPAELAEFIESLGEWLSPEWPESADLQVEGFSPEYYPRVAALAARALEENNPENARELAELAVRVWPNDFLILRHAGIVLGELGDPESGRLLLDRALEGYPAAPDILRGLQEFRAADGDRDGALQAAETLFNLVNPQDDESEEGAVFQKKLGLSAQVGKKLQDALGARDYQQALDIYDQALDKTDDADVRNALLYHRAVVARIDGRPKDAAAALDELLKSDKLSDIQRAVALAERGRNLAADGRKQDAEADYRAAAELNPANADYLRRAALNAADPVIGLEETIRRFPLDDRAYWDLANIHRDASRFAKVIEVMRRLARVSPAEPSIYKLLGDIQTTAGHNRDAFVNQQIHAALRNAQQ